MSIYDSVYSVVNVSYIIPFILCLIFKPTFQNIFQEPEGSSTLDLDLVLSVMEVNCSTSSLASFSN